MTKTPEDIAEILNKWNGIQIEHTEKAISSVLEEQFGSDFCNEDVKAVLDRLEKQTAMKHLLEPRPDKPQWTKTPVSPFMQTICPHTLHTKTKDMSHENAAPPNKSIFGKSVLGGGEYSFDEISLDDVVDTLTLTIVYDVANKKIVLLCGILNYTNEDQQNIGFSSGSCSGKSHICLEIAKFFPEEDVQKLGYASPQSFMILVF